MRNSFLLIFLFLVLNLTAQTVVQKSLIIDNKTTFNPRTIKPNKSFIVADKLPNHSPGINTLKQQINYINRRAENNNINMLKQFKLTDSSGFIGGSSGGGTPKDNHMAISNGGMIVNVLNSFVRIYDENGAFKKAFRLSSFANKSTNQKPGGSLPVLNRTYDPRVKYDPISDRFMVVFMQGSTFATSWVIVAFSSTNNPLDPWNVYALKGNNYGDDTWSDYPIIAMTKEDLFITVNQLVNDEDWRTGFRHSVVWQLNKKDGYEGKKLKTLNYSNIKHDGKIVRSICPVQSYEPIENAKMYLLSVKPMQLKNDTLYLHTISNSVASGKAKFTTKLIDQDNKYGLPPNAHQPKIGFKLQTNDARIMDAAYRDGEITYVQNTINFPTNKAAIGFGILGNLNGKPSQKLNIIHSDSMEFGYPSLAYVGSNISSKRLLITFSHSSKKLYPGTSAIFYNGWDKFSEIMILKRGEGLINASFLADSVERWGDYTSVQPRYNRNDEMWIVGSYGSSENSTAYTWISKLTLGLNFVGMPILKQKQAMVYPNPAQTTIAIKINRANNEGFKYIQLVNMNGKICRKKLIDNLPNGSAKIHLDVQGLKGIYSVQIIDNKGITRPLGNTLIN